VYLRWRRVSRKDGSVSRKDESASRKDEIVSRKQIRVDCPARTRQILRNPAFRVCGV